MIATILLVIFGSALLSLLIACQVKYVSPEIVAVVRYNLVILPLIFLANTALGASFTRAHETVKNLPLLAAGQSFVYYLFLLVFSVLLVGDKVSFPRAVPWVCAHGGGGVCTKRLKLANELGWIAFALAQIIADRKPNKKNRVLIRRKIFLMN